MTWNEPANDDTEPVPKKLGEDFNRLMAEMIPADRIQPPKQRETWEWTEADTWQGIPQEFHGAVISDGLLSILRSGVKTLAIVGPPGTGKTRTLYAIAHRMRMATLRKLVGTFIERERVTKGYDTIDEPTSETIAREIRYAERLEIITEVGDIRAMRYDREALDSWVNSRYWLAVDDIGAVDPSEWVREAIYHLANERRGKGAPTIWTSNLSPQKIRDTFGAAIASRILGGAVIETDGADRRLQP